MKNIKVAPIKPIIKYGGLEKIGIRAGTIEEVIDMERSDKLVKLVVDFGDHKRNVVVGMKKDPPNFHGALTRSSVGTAVRNLGGQGRENSKEIERRQALFVVNLEPRKMMGELSEGILFDIGYADKIIPVLAVPEKPVPNGAHTG